MLRLFAKSLGFNEEFKDGNNFCRLFALSTKASKLKVLSGEMDMSVRVVSVNRSSLKGEAQRFLENQSVPHPVRYISRFRATSYSCGHL
jgi:hypothetical protein